MGKRVHMGWKVTNEISGLMELLFFDLGCGPMRVYICKIINLYEKDWCSLLFINRMLKKI